MQKKRMSTCEMIMSTCNIIMLTCNLKIELENLIVAWVKSPTIKARAEIIDARCTKTMTTCD